MLSELAKYQGKAGFFKLKFQNDNYFSKYWKVQTGQVFAQTVTYVIKRIGHETHDKFATITGAILGLNSN